MTVAEYIEALKKLRQDAVVMYEYDGSWNNAEPPEEIVWDSLERRKTVSLFRCCRTRWKEEK